MSIKDLKNTTVMSVQKFHIKHWIEVVYDRNHYFGLGPIPKPKPKLADTFGRYRNQYRNHISKGESGYGQYGVFFPFLHHIRATKIKFGVKCYKFLDQF